jgi:hypothetical protein
MKKDIVGDLIENFQPKEIKKSFVKVCTERTSVMKIQNRVNG